MATELFLSWTEFKSFIDNVGVEALHLSHLETSSTYIVWVDFRGVNVRCHLPKETNESAEFEASYKAKSNIKEADRVRITTCKLGRKLNDRSITFKTSSPGSVNNDNWQAVDFGDVVYSIRDADGTVVSEAASARQTWVDFHPSYDFEISGGGINLPSTLPGDQDQWEIHVVGAPDIPANLGGSVNFVSNNRIKWVVGGKITIDASLNPAEVSGSVSALARKIRFIILHPLGAEAEFQLNVKVYK